MCPASAPEDRLDRRAFLRLGIAAGSWAAVACLPACAGSDASDGGGLDDEPARPLLLPWGVGAAHLVAPLEERPLAYVSRASMRIYIEPGQRDRVHRILGVHISVSTGHWRIPLPGDDPKVPISPGDALREFEETPLSGWDPGAPPREGDLRVRRGDPVSRVLDLPCTPLLGADPSRPGGTWVRGGPWTVQRLDGPPGRGGVERFLPLGTARRYTDRECGEGGDQMEIFTWRSPPTS